MGLFNKSIHNATAASITFVMNVVQGLANQTIDTATRAVKLLTLEALLLSLMVSSSGGFDAFSDVLEFDTDGRGGTK